LSFVSGDFDTSFTGLVDTSIEAKGSFVNEDSFGSSSPFVNNELRIPAAVHDPVVSVADSSSRLCEDVALPISVVAAVNRAVLPFARYDMRAISVDAALAAVRSARTAHSETLGEAEAIAWANGFEFDPGIGDRDMRCLEAAGSLEAMQRSEHSVSQRPGLTAARFTAFDAQFSKVLDPKLREVLRLFAEDGVPTLVDPAFIPNGSAPSPRAKYIRIHTAYHKNIAELHEKGVIWLFPSSELHAMVGSRIHYNANHWVLKGGTPAGRSIQDTTAAEDGTWPLNHEGVKAQAEAAWGRLKHPTILQLIVDVILAAQEKFAAELAAGETLVLWKMDLKGAFNLLHVSPASVHLWAFKLLGDLTMIFPVGCFGWTNYPHAFGVLTLCLEAAIASVLRGFVRAYVDDFMGCCLLRDVHRDMSTARSIFTLLLGEGSVAEPKSEFGRRLTWIGWDVDLDDAAWCLAIGKSLLVKSIHVFFAVDPLAIARLDLEKVSSYAGRFSLVFPFLKPFVAALYAEYSGRRRHLPFVMSVFCLEALEAWRYFLLSAQIFPKRFGRSLRSFVRKEVALTLVWDASLYGIGATLFEGDGAEGQVLKLVKIPFDYREYPFGGDSSFQNLSEYLGVTVAIALAIRLGFAGCGLRIVGDSVTALQWTAEGTYVSGYHDRAATIQAMLRADADVHITKREWLSGDDNAFCDNLSRRYDPSFSDADVSAPADVRGTSRSLRIRWLPATGDAPRHRWQRDIFIYQWQEKPQPKNNRSPLQNSLFYNEVRKTTRVRLSFFWQGCSQVELETRLFITSFGFIRFLLVRGGGIIFEEFSMELAH